MENLDSKAELQIFQLPVQVRSKHGAKKLVLGSILCAPVKHPFQLLPHFCMLSLDGDK